MFGSVRRSGGAPHRADELAHHQDTRHAQPPSPTQTLDSVGARWLGCWPTFRPSVTPTRLQAATRQRARCYVSGPPGSCSLHLHREDGRERAVLLWGKGAGVVRNGLPHHEHCAPVGNDRAIRSSHTLVERDT